MASMSFFSANSCQQYAYCPDPRPGRMSQPNLILLEFLDNLPANRISVNWRNQGNSRMTELSNGLTIVGLSASFLRQNTGRFSGERPLCGGAPKVQPESSGKLSGKRILDRRPSGESARADAEGIILSGTRTEGSQPKRLRRFVPLLFVQNMRDAFCLL